MYCVTGDDHNPRGLLGVSIERNAAMYVYGRANLIRAQGEVARAKFIQGS